ncbi:Iq-domain 14, putative [Theobroma cacao]|uniref:Iq-domain 14, putative n=1 Tax=Theobroma cacao TaxID=3641 RepID=A0A061E087_THECC|nr:Iq-domain 14, putative [Theobroma cacao]
MNNSMNLNLSTLSHLPSTPNHTTPETHRAKMMDIWSWICELPNSEEWAESDSPLIFTLASAKVRNQGDSTRSIQLKAERTSGSNLEVLVTFNICFEGFQASNAQKPLWVSDTCPLLSEQPFLPLVLQLLQEIINRSPSVPDSTCPRSQLQRLKPEPISWIMESHSPDSFSRSKYRSLNVEVSVGLQTLTPLPRQHLGISYATEAHGFWTLKGYAPVNAMKLTHSSNQKSIFPAIGAKESLLRYALAHQQLEAVIQLEYSVGFYDGYIQVNACVDNLRFHVAKLGFRKKEDDMDYFEERHFPSRIRVWVGPEVGSTYVYGLSLGRSTNNGEREIETQRIVKGSIRKLNNPQVKARSRVSLRNKMKNWRWDQDAEGNAAVFDAVLCDNVTGHEIATCKSLNYGNGGNGDNSLQNRYYGVNRPFTKTGGLVFAGDDYGERVAWRLSREMEGSVLKWRIGGEVWLSYWPNNVGTSYIETRCVEWCDEVDLPLITAK